ncbi:MAG: PilZ domain-containing protein [Phycisphaerales bacterium JB040]
MRNDPITSVLDNRRAAPRRADNAPIKVRRPGSLHSITATVVDRSEGGVGIVAGSADHTLMPGAAIELLPVASMASPVRSDSAIRATVAWVSLSGAGARVGIRYAVAQPDTIADEAPIAA